MHSWMSKTAPLEMQQSALWNGKSASVTSHLDFNKEAYFVTRNKLFST